MNVEPGLYRHFKGGVCRVLGVGKHSETLEDYVVYEHTDGEQKGLWVRPLSMFCEKVERDGYKGPRFRKIGE